MKQNTLDIIHRSYQTALTRSNNILETVENLYSILSEVEVDEDDSIAFDSFLDGLRGCIQHRKKTLDITNEIIYINITLMYIILWLNETQKLDIDINLYSRRKSLESELTKILVKSDSNLSINIRDRFGLRGILLNKFSSEKCQEYIYIIFDAIAGILGGKNRKMRREFEMWCSQNEKISSHDMATISHVLSIPFSIDFLKDFIKKPKDNGYQSLQFTMTIQMYSPFIPGAQFEVQLRSQEMHRNTLCGTASHAEYKTNSIGEDILKVFTIDDFTKLHITGFVDYHSQAEDRDGLHWPKNFSDRRVSTTLVP